MIFYVKEVEARVCPNSFIVSRITIVGINALIVNIDAFLASCGGLDGVGRVREQLCQG